MAVATQSFTTLKELLLQSVGDYISVLTTTNIGAGTTVISTTLNEYDDGRDDYFNDQYVYIAGTANVGIRRKVEDYTTATGTLGVHGGNLAAESAAATVYVTRYDPDHLKRALLRAVEEIYPTLYLPLDDITLVTGNILPDSSFEDWSSSSALQWYSRPSIDPPTLLQTSATGLVRNGTYSVKSTAGGLNSYFYISSDNYSRLLDLQNQTVDFYCRAYPEVANDAAIVVYTINSAGSTQTLTSSTANPAGAWTILKLENQLLNDNLEEIQIRFRVATNAKYAYFDDAMLFGGSTSGSIQGVREYLLPTKFRDGHLSHIRMQTVSNQANQNPPAYDTHPFATMSPGRLLRHDIVDEGNWRYARLLDSVVSQRRLRLTGMKPLETLSADTDTITLDAEKVPLLIEYAKIIFYERESKPVSLQDIHRWNFELGRSAQRFQSLYYKQKMTPPMELL